MKKVKKDAVLCVRIPARLKLDLKRLNVDVARLIREVLEKAVRC